MIYTIRQDPTTGSPYMAVRTKGSELLLHAATNKGTAFPPEERDALELHGLIPPAVSTLEQQLARAHEACRAKPSNLEKYIYLTSLQDRNETLFYRLIRENIEEMLPLVYTPTVGEACQRFSHIYRRTRGLYISYEDRGRIAQLLRNYECATPVVIVATDGERILGLGDQGAGGMGIPIGKLCLYTVCAGVPPQHTLPIMLDVGTDNAERLADPLYLGLRRPRVRGAEYQAFIDDFVDAVMAVFPDALLQWEDFLKGNALHQLSRFRDRLCTFNDDIQGTAAVVLAGLYGGLRLTGQRLREQRILLAGAGAAAQGIAELLLAALQEDGLTPRESRDRIWMVDRTGLVTRDRPALEAFKAAFARDPSELAAFGGVDPSQVTLAQTVAAVHPTILLGTSGTPGTFSREVLQGMAAATERPMIFPLSNPTSCSECTPREAIETSRGRAIVATGSPFAPVEYDGRQIRVGQCNNAYVFPGVGLGAWAGRLRRITDGVFLDAARVLAAQVNAEEQAAGALYPSLRRIQECSHAVAVAVIRRAVLEGHADPSVLTDVEARVRRAMWLPDYLPMRHEPLPPGAPATG